MQQRWPPRPGLRSSNDGASVAGTSRENCARPREFLFTFADQHLDREENDEQSQKALLRERFGSSGWECPHILDALDDTHDLYFDRVSQIRMDPRDGLWARGASYSSATPHFAYPCSEERDRHWPWPRPISWPANSTEPAATMSPLFDGTRKCSHRLSQRSRRRRYVSEIPSRPNQNSRCSSAIKS